jgi:hypothetical protein
LAEGLPVDEAVAEARKSVSLAINNTLEWATPVLHMRSNDGMLFNIHPSAVPAQPPARVTVSPAPVPAPAIAEIPAVPAGVAAAAAGAAAAVPAAFPRGSAVPQPGGAGNAGGGAPPAAGVAGAAHPFPWRIAFAVLAVLAVAVILILVFSRPPSAPVISEQPTSTSAPTLTEAPVVIPSAIPTVAPTNTSTPEPTIVNTPQPSSTPTPEISSTPTLFSFNENFQNNNNGWRLWVPNGTPDRPQISSSIADKQYIYNISCPVSYSGVECVVYVTIPIKTNLKNFQLSLDYTIIKASNDNELKLGVQFRGGGRGTVRDYYYSAYFRRDGYYSAQVRAQGNSTTLFTYLISHGMISRDVGTTNHIEVSAQENHFSLYANGGLLKSFDDSTLTQPGDMVLGLYVSKGMSASFSIENVSVIEAP